MRVGGWVRLWIVVTVLYGVTVIFVAYDGRPRLEYLQDAWIRDASDAIAQAISRESENPDMSVYEIREALFAGKSNAELIAYFEQVAKSPTKNQRLYSSEIVRINEKHRQLISQLVTLRAKHILLSIAWWFGPALVLFALGWSIGWIIKGFRGKPV